MSNSRERSSDRHLIKGVNHERRERHENDKLEKVNARRALVLRLDDCNENLRYLLEQTFHSCSVHLVFTLCLCGSIRIAAAKGKNHRETVCRSYSSHSADSWFLPSLVAARI